MKEISVNEIKGIRIGQVENEKAATGCTVFVSEAVKRAVFSAENAYGFISVKSLL